MDTLPLDSRSNKPLYQVVEEHLRSMIDSGEFVAGDLIPSDPQLASQLSVSTGTIKKAIDNLVRERRLYRHQGKGTYVSRIDFNNSLFRFTTYGDETGHETRIHKVTTERLIEKGAAMDCKRLGVAAGAPLLYIERVGYANDVPVMVEYSRWRAELLPGLENQAVHIPDLLYALIEEEYKVPVIRANEALTAGGADEKTARLLQIDVGAPVLVLNRTTFTTDNRVIEVRTSKGRADRFSYTTEIR
jgi:GntR family transcriptional regulator